MEILIDPNVAYLLLVVGVVLAIMALFAPGTGILEVSALFVLLLAGWVISQVSQEVGLNWWALLLLVIGVVPLILAMQRSRNLVFLGIALAAFIIGSAYLFHSEGIWPPVVNPILAIVASIIASGYLWIAGSKVLETEKIKPRHDLGKLIGEKGEARTDVFNEGSVQIGSELWSARSNVEITAGSKVQVVKRDGFTLEVEPYNPEDK